MYSFNEVTNLRVECRDFIVLGQSAHDLQVAAPVSDWLHTENVLDGGGVCLDHEYLPGIMRQPLRDGAFACEEGFDFFGIRWSDEFFDLVVV